MLNLNLVRTILPRWSFFAEPGYACVYRIRQGKKATTASGLPQTIWSDWELLWVPPLFRPWHLLLNPESNHFSWIMAQTEEWRNLQAKSTDDVIDPEGLRHLQWHLQPFIRAKLSNSADSLWQLQLGLVAQNGNTEFSEIYDFGARKGPQDLFDGT